MILDSICINCNTQTKCAEVSRIGPLSLGICANCILKLAEEFGYKLDESVLVKPSTLKDTHVYSDGSFRLGKGGWAFHVVFPDGTVHTDSGPLTVFDGSPVTNQVMELYAVLKAFDYLSRVKMPLKVKFHIDNDYVYGILRLNNKATANKALVSDLRDIQRRQGYYDIEVDLKNHKEEEKIVHNLASSYVN